MSEVISFRLRKENPREARALDILRSRKIKGYTIRQIITDAILIWASGAMDCSMDKAWFEELNAIINMVYQSALAIDKNHNSVNKSQEENFAGTKLHVGFITSVKTAFKPGLRLDSG